MVIYISTQTEEEEILYINNILHQRFGIAKIYRGIIIISMFTPESLFDLSEFVHHQLFEPKLPAWEAIRNIKFYLEKAELGKIEGEIDNRAYLINPELISIGKRTVVEAGAYIQGPCIIGDDCEVRSGAYIRGNFIAGNGCVIGHTTEVKNVIFFNEAKAGHFAYIGDSIVGNRVNIGAGVKCANLRFDEKNIRIRVLNGKMDTGLRKLGAILGDDVHLGCNAVLNPGTIMGKKSGAYPCLNVSGVISENHIVKNKELISAL